MNYNIIFFGILISLSVGILLSSFKSVFLNNVLSNTYSVLMVVLMTSTLIFSIIGWFELDQGSIIYATEVGNIRLDGFSLILIILIQFLFLICGVFSFYYIEAQKISSYFTFLFALQLGMNLVILTDHLFSLFIFWELMVLSGYVLVVFEKSSESLEAGFKYLIISSLGSLTLLMGIALLYGLVGDLSFQGIQQNTDIISTTLGKVSLALIVIGFGVTGGFVALNQWLPDAHPAAPAPISAILSGLVVKAGIYGIYRSITLIISDISYSTSSLQILIILGLITMTEGNIMVLAQLQREDNIDFKRILAYSTTVHLGFILLVVAIQSSLGNLALLSHIINHALAKGLLFLLSGYLIHELGSRDLRDLQGIGRVDKFLGFLLFCGLMSLGGLPFTGGFVSKFLILVSVAENGNGLSSTFITWTIVIAVINSALAFGGYLWILKWFVFDPPNGNLDGVEKFSNGKLFVKLILSTLAFMILLFGILPQSLIDPINSVL